MPELWTSTLNPQGPNHDFWIRILGTSSVPIMSPRWSLVNIRAENNVQVYLLNLRGLTLSQRSRLVVTLAKDHGLSISEVESEIAKVGMPIRAADVIVSFSTRAFV